MLYANVTNQQTHIYMYVQWHIINLQQHDRNMLLEINNTLLNTYRSLATRVSQPQIWHFLIIGTERNVCRCTFNRYSVMTQFAKLAAEEQLCRRCTHRKLWHFKTFKILSWKSQILSCDTVVLWQCCVVTLLYCDMFCVVTLVTPLCCDTVVLWQCCAVTPLCCDSVVLWHRCAVTLLCCDTVVLWQCCVVTPLCCDTVMLRQCCVETVLCCDTVALWH